MARIESWEKDFRLKLEKELSEGVYEIGISPMIALTNKQGKINFEVIMQKRLRKILKSLK